LSWLLLLRLDLASESEKRGVSEGERAEKGGETDVPDAERDAERLERLRDADLLRALRLDERRSGERTGERERGGEAMVVIGSGSRVCGVHQIIHNPR
jgi:hypothetical protein